MEQSNDGCVTIDAMDIGIEFEELRTSDQHVSTKEDLPHLTPDEYSRMNTGDPGQMEQMRMPDEFPGFHVSTKEDLPHLTQDEYDRMNARDPSQIMQMRMPVQFPGPRASTKEDLPHLTPDEYSRMNTGDPGQMEQMRMPDEFPGFHVSTKEDLPHLTPDEYSRTNTGDPGQMEQMRMPDEFPGFHVSTKEDLPHLTADEYSRINTGDPSQMEQMRMPDEFPGFHVSTKQDLPHLTADEYDRMNARDPSQMEQMRMPDEFPGSRINNPTIGVMEPVRHIARKERSSEKIISSGAARDIYEFMAGESEDRINQENEEGNKSPASKDDLPTMTPENYEAANKKAPDQIEQMRMPDEFPFSVQNITKGDLPNISRMGGDASCKTTSDDERNQMSDNNPPNDDEFDFDINQPSIAKKNEEEDPGLVVSSLTQTQNDDDDFDFDTVQTSAPVEKKGEKDPPKGNVEARFKPINNPFAKEIELANGKEEQLKKVEMVNGRTVLPSEIIIATTDTLSEWDNVQEITARFEEEGDKKIDKKVEATPLISYGETLQHFESSNLDAYKTNIKPTVTRSGFSAFTHALFGPPKLNKDLVEERGLIFTVAACPFNNEDPVHLNVLKTIYRKLTGSKFDPQRFGGHWDQIGFQGNDPASDLRGTGFLGLLQLLYLVMDPRTYQLARDIYRLSHHETQNFPMAVMSINMTRIALQVTREGVYNKEFNKRRNVFPLFNEIYSACYAKMFTVWKQQHKTIADSGFVIKDVEAMARKKPKVLMGDLEKTLELRKKQNVDVDNAAQESLKFQAVCDFDDDD